MAYNSPYYGNNAYMQQPYNQFYQQPVQPIQPIQRQEQYQQPSFNRQVGLQGKSVDNIEVVKATDIPLDGTISYFPLTDGSAIVTKQLQMDGTSRTIVYKPVDNEEFVPKKYITVEDLEEKMQKINNSDYKEDIKSLKREIKDLKEEIEELKIERTGLNEHNTIAKNNKKS